MLQGLNHNNKEEKQNVVYLEGRITKKYFFRN